MKKKLIIFGSAPCTEIDIALIDHLDTYDFMAVGVDALEHYNGRIDYVTTNHCEDIPRIQEKMGDRKYLIISFDPRDAVDIVVPLCLPSGSSAITGAVAAISLGYKKIILCGCPLTGNAPEGNPYEAFRAGWEAKRNELLGKVKSMSGWTRMSLGAPTEEWLNG